MNKKRGLLTLISLLVFICLVGCRHGDLKVSTVFENQPAPHSGFNVGPDWWVEQGDPVPVTGVVIWVKGLEPNDILGSKRIK